MSVGECCPGNVLQDPDPQQAGAPAPTPTTPPSQEVRVEVPSPARTLLVVITITDGDPSHGSVWTPPTVPGSTRSLPNLSPKTKIKIEVLTNSTT